MNKRIIELIERYPSVEPCLDSIIAAYEAIKECFIRKSKLLLAGNGGSNSDCEHIVGELMKGFVKKRPMPDDIKKQLLCLDHERGELLSSSLQMGLPAINLSNHNSLNTAFINDVKNGGSLFFAQQVLGFGKEGDVLFLISTSGNSENLIYANMIAKIKHMKTIVLTGRDGGVLAKRGDISIIVPEKETYKIQELHLPIYHTLCLLLEDHFFPV